MTNYIPDESWMVHFREEVNRRGSVTRRRDEMKRRVENRRKVVPQWRKRNTGGGSDVSTKQREVIQWLITNEIGKYYDPMRGLGNPSNMNQAARTIEDKRTEIATRTHALLEHQIESRKVIEPVFRSVLAEVTSGPEKLQELVAGEAEMSPEAQAIAALANHPSVTIKTLPDGIRLDKNGKKRYAKGNKWGKRAGSLAPSDIG